MLIMYSILKINFTLTMTQYYLITGRSKLKTILTVSEISDIKSNISPKLF